VTASDRQGRSIAERALDVFVYAPAGALLSALQDVTGMAAKGKARLDQEISNARVVGRFAVDFGLRQLKQQVDWLAGEARGTGTPARRPAQDSSTRRVPTVRRAATARPRRSPPHGAGRDAAAARSHADVGLGIPEYDTLSASQVVRRLDGLGPEELRAVVRHEAANRARRTILNRAEQLLAAHVSGGPSGGTSDEPPGG
jgi:hypothetical protein